MEFAGNDADAIPVQSLLGSKAVELPPEPIAVGWAPIGYDVVSMRPAEANMMFALDCSPLSCCSLFIEHPVNAHCLIDSWDTAVTAALAFAQTEPEPGPYCIVEVLEVRERLRNI